MARKIVIRPKTTPKPITARDVEAGRVELSRLFDDPGDETPLPSREALLRGEVTISEYLAGKGGDDAKEP